MLRFLEREGYDVTYTTNIDTHQDGATMQTRKAFLSVGHDEYWSNAMRMNAEAARDAGIGLGFFSANTAYWQVRFEPSTTGQPNRTMVGYKERALTEDPYALDGDPTNDHLITVRWRDNPVNRPEDALLGVYFIYDAINTDIVISNASLWPFAGTGLANGNKLIGLLGYEVDALGTATPVGTTVLAHSPWTSVWGGSGHSQMVTYTASSGATVFATGSIQWAWGLDNFNAPNLRPVRLSAAAQQITRNVLARLIAPPAAPPAPSTLTGAVQGGNRVNLAWKDNSTNESAFEIYRSPNGTTFSLLTTVGPNVTTYQEVPGPGKKWYRVRATNVGASAYSNTVMVNVKK